VSAASQEDQELAKKSTKTTTPNANGTDQKNPTPINSAVKNETAGLSQNASKKRTTAQMTKSLSS